ncbi:TrmH family RNA methyltransferase [Flagellimonas pacifica]|uniref:tRNA (guanosine(18)-2'-O)-methyltransferase n=1 Tax=Flagellimonas pacifica TaxID=1247520 RepID=A0A285MVN6_9FLAO|nr:RNA methyltransferase [Allomuricauda parva]SNZ00607.1 tRNA (guanosine-2'-O-)-methyltransferase [Allomuricauda parva]
MFDHDLFTYLEGFLTEERKQRFLEVLQNRTKYLTVAIEDVFQLHNTSAVIRSCDAFGIQEVHVVEDRFGKRLDKNIAMGAEQWVDVNRYQTTSECIDSLKQSGFQIIATTPHNDSRYLADFEVNTPTALFFGTEKEGLSEEVMEKADGFLKIPMVGFSESLNISVSAAIIIQQLTQKLKESNVDWQLSKEEILEKRLDWTKKSIKDVEGIIERYLSE